MSSGRPARSKATRTNVRFGEGFRAPALCDVWTAAGAGARKPPKEETAEK